MDASTKEKALRKQKRYIFKLLDSNCPEALYALNFLKQYFMLLDYTSGSNYSIEFKNMIIERIHPRWLLARECNVCDKTMERHEHLIVDSFLFMIDFYKKH